MLTVSGWKNGAASTTFLLISAFALALVSIAAQAQSLSGPEMKARIDALVPELERYLQDGMANWQVPGVAIGIVTGEATPNTAGQRGRGGHHRGQSAHLSERAISHRRPQTQMRMW
jgi:hypothetical protein